MEGKEVVERGPQGALAGVRAEGKGVWRAGSGWFWAPVCFSGGPAVSLVGCEVGCMYGGLERAGQEKAWLGCQRSVSVFFFTFSLFLICSGSD